MDFGLQLADILAWAVVAGLLGYIGTRAVPTVRRLGPSPWTDLFLLTAWMHPICAGAAIGLVPSLPAPAGMGDGAAGRVLWYALAGALGLWVYRILRARLETKVARAKLGER